MKISLEWLKEYIDIELSAEQIADCLSDLGFPIEGIERVGDDTVIDVEVTSNRGDCLSYIGVARELALATGKTIRLPEVSYDELAGETGMYVDVNISAPELCNRYTARYIEGVKVGPSPEWMQRRLEASGVRSVNNVVDSTNYAMLEIGQPPHAFDYDKLQGDKITVRRALAGEKIISIDHRECELKPDMLIIADDGAPVAIAGVMGGFETEVSESTTKVLLEEAVFAPVSVRSTSRALVMNSEASFRFERNIDVANIDWASRRCAQLITMTAGGKVAGGIVDAYPMLHIKPEVAMRLARLERLLGYEIPVAKLLDIYSRLGFEPVLNEAQDVITCKCPTWRNDLHREVDLIEEAARAYGFDKIPVNSRITIEVASADKRQKCRSRTGGYLNACGYYETLGITFTDPQTAKLFTGLDPQEHLKVKDASRKGSNLLRRTLIGNLAEVMKNNRNFGNTGCRFYEIADTYAAESGSLDERTMLSLITEGDIRELRGVVEGLLCVFSKTVKVEFKATKLCWADTAAGIYADEEKIGVCGKFSASVCKNLGLKDVVPAALEIDFSVVEALMGEELKISHLHKFPSIARDFSLIVDESLTWAQLESAVMEQAPELLEKMSFVDIYRGKPIEAGRKSLTFQLVFRDDSGTLTHEQVDELEKPLVATLMDKFNAELRTA
ncbi:MAG: phenylalanine--tRNA ligase subunit beta [Phycisphaerae bacterium]